MIQWITVRVTSLALWWVARQLRRHEDYAWSWHSNIAMVAYDAIADFAGQTARPSAHRAANERAADFMARAFGVDMRKNRLYHYPR